ncbi:MAG: hypothetical protein ACE15D_16425 [Candidatus Eisenbacteria bacterium]
MRRRRSRYKEWRGVTFGLGSQASGTGWVTRWDRSLPDPLDGIRGAGQAISFEAILNASGQLGDPGKGNQSSKPKGRSWRCSSPFRF